MVRERAHVVNKLLSYYYINRENKRFITLFFIVNRIELSISLHGMYLKSVKIYCSNNIKKIIINTETAAIKSDEIF